MTANEPRGVLVFDVGSTNTKLVLFDAAGKALMERRTPSRHVPGPVYQSLDNEPALELLRQTLGAFDAVAPVDVIVPSTHGSALALLDADGKLALPMMDYLTEPPRGVFEAYAAIEPPFEETFCPTNPMALTLGLQLMWQQQAFPDAFARVKTIMPMAQYFAFELTGKATTEVTALGAQTHLLDVRTNDYSSLVKAKGWDKLFAPRARAFDTVGVLAEKWRPEGFRGHGAVKAGIHDSNANYLRYLAAGLPSFTLLSTGTWIIVFDTDADYRALDPRRDTATNTDYLGRPVACGRFMGGHEIEAVLAGAPAGAADLATTTAIVSRGTMALPSFTDSGGPMPATGGRGRIVGPAAGTDAERASLAALYCAQMVDQSLQAVGAKNDIIVDGPFSQNTVFMAVLAALRPGQRVLASDLRDG
nr:FGGY family carbohydrate kinase [Rhizobiaceae bacterium]